MEANVGEICNLAVAARQAVSVPDLSRSDHLADSPRRTSEIENLAYVAQLAKFQRYIAANPVKARLKKGEYLLWKPT